MKTQINAPQNWWFQVWLSRLLESFAKVYEDQVYKQGMGRHSREEVMQWGIEDVQALSDYLSNKPFLMGDKPCEVDCIFFGFMAILAYAPISESTGDLLKRFPNLMSYVERLKARYFPDWDELLTNDKTRIN